MGNFGTVHRLNYGALLDTKVLNLDLSKHRILVVEDEALIAFEIGRSSRMLAAL